MYFDMKPPSSPHSANCNNYVHVVYVPVLLYMKRPLVQVADDDHHKCSRVFVLVNGRKTPPAQVAEGQGMY